MRRDTAGTVPEPTRTKLSLFQIHALHGADRDLVDLVLTDASPDRFVEALTNQRLFEAGLLHLLATEQLVKLGGDGVIYRGQVVLHYLHLHRIVEHQHDAEEELIGRLAVAHDRDGNGFELDLRELRGRR